MFLIFLLSLIENEEHASFFHLLYTKYQKKMLYAAWQVLKDPQEAEDVMQDTFYSIASNDRIMKRLLELNAQSEIYVINYITKMCKHNALHKADSAVSQKESVTDSIEGRFADDTDFAENPEDILCRYSDAERMMQALGKLPSDDEVLLHLLYFQNFTMEEIAQQLNITKNALYVRHHRALKALSKLLEPGALSS